MWTGIRDSNGHIRLYQAFNLGEKKAYPSPPQPVFNQVSKSPRSALFLGSYIGLGGWHLKPQKPTSLYEILTLELWQMTCGQQHLYTFTTYNTLSNTGFGKRM